MITSMKFQKHHILFFCTICCVCVFFSTAQAKIVDRIMAIVDNEIITQVQLEKAIATYKKQIQASGLSSEQRFQAMKKLKKNMLAQMIDRSLARQEAKKYRIEVPDKEVDAALENMRLQNHLSPAQFDMALQSEGIRLKDYKEQIRQEILQSRLVNQVVRSKVVVTESDIRQYYDEHINDYQESETYILSNILVQNRALADRIREQLDQGKNFAKLARQYSVSANGADGGKLGGFTMDSFSPVIRAGIQDLKKGDYSQVLGTGQGYQIFLVEDIVPAGGKPFDLVKEDIHTLLHKKAEKEKFASWLASLKQHAHIEIKDPVLAESEAK